MQMRFRQGDRIWHGDELVTFIRHIHEGFSYLDGNSQLLADWLRGDEELESSHGRILLLEIVLLLDIE